jgi:uncharacterized membrane protein
MPRERSRDRPARFDRYAGRAGLLVAAADLPFTFRRTLMPRSTSDQALVTGLSFTANHAIAQLVQESLQALGWLSMGRAARHAVAEDNAYFIHKWSRATLALDATAMVAGSCIELLLAPKPREQVSRAAVRTTGYWLRTAGAAGGAVVGASEARRSSSPTAAAVSLAGLATLGAEVWRRLPYGRHGKEAMPSTVKAEFLLSPKSLGMSLAIAALMALVGARERQAATAVAAAAARVLPGDENVWQPVGHLVTLGAVGFLSVRLIERMLSNIEHRETGFETAFDLRPPNSALSGSADSLVDFATMSRQGRRFVWTVTTPQQIEQVIGETARAQPIRAYVGLASADDDAARAKLAIDELDRTNAFSRSHLLVAAPTGTGYVNYAAVGAFELLTRGDCATVALQYAARPSVLSLDRVREGRHVYRRFFTALRERLERMPPNERPAVTLFGESLGSWASQDAFVDRGTNGLIEDGIDRALWIGTPYFSKWKERVLYDDRPDVDRSTVAVCASPAEWHGIDDAARAQIRFVMATHDNDGVALFGPPLAIQAPSWLTDPQLRSAEVPADMVWMPNTTFFQVLIDMKNSANVVPGRFDDQGHDYRGSLVPFLHATLGFDASAAQLGAIRSYLEGSELFRTNWITRHGHAGTSMAVRVVEELIREARERGEDADARLLAVIQRIASEDFAAAGGVDGSTSAATV